jgi:hypothetical protein
MHPATARYVGRTVPMLPSSHDVFEPGQLSRNRNCFQGVYALPMFLPILLDSQKRTLRTREPNERKLGTQQRLG